MPSPTLPAEFAAARLHIVTGKGGVGKTTVAASLALALASTGKRVLSSRSRGARGCRRRSTSRRWAPSEVRLVAHHSGGELWGLSVDAKAALLEYLQLFYKLGRAGSALEKIGAIDFATTIAPGVRDVLLTGKVYEAAGRPKGGRGAQEQRPALRRRRARRAADRPGRALPQRQRRRRRRRQGGPDPVAGRLDHPDAARQAHPRAHGDPARGDAGPGEPRRAARPRRRRAPPRRDHRQPDPRAPPLPRPPRGPRTASDDEPRRDAARRAHAAPACARPTRWSAASSARAATTPSASPSRTTWPRRSRPPAAPVIELPALTGGIEDGGIAVLADELLEQGVR